MIWIGELLDENHQQKGERYTIIVRKKRVKEQKRYDSKAMILEYIPEKDRVTIYINVPMF